MNVLPEMKKDINDIYLVLPAQRKEDNFEYEMLQNNNIYGLLPVNRQMINGITSYYYDIGNQQSISKLYEVCEIEYQEIKAIMVSLSLLIRRLKEYLLDENCILVDPDYIYMDMDKKTISFLYYPDERQNLLVQLKALSEFLLSKVQYKDDKAVELVYCIFKESRNENFTLRSIMNSLEECETREMIVTEPMVHEETRKYGLSDENNDVMESKTDIIDETEHMNVKSYILLVILSVAGIAYETISVLLYRKSGIMARDYIVMVLCMVIFGIVLLRLFMKRRRIE